MDSINVDEVIKWRENVERENEISNIIKQTHQFKLSLVDLEAEREVQYYITEEMYDEIHHFLQSFYKKIDKIKQLPYIIPRKDIEDKSNDEIRDMLGLNKKVKYKDFIIISSSKIKDCKNNYHKIKKIKVDIPVVQKDSKVVVQQIDAYYCETCNLHFITDEDYKNISSCGFMLHQHMTLKDYKEYVKNMENGFAELNKESFLKRHGYSVSKQDGLNDNERQSILAYIIETSKLGISENNWDRGKIIWFLNHQIDMHPQANFESAREKWSRDLDFLEDYSHNNQIVYKIRRIIHN